MQGELSALQWCLSCREGQSRSGYMRLIQADTGTNTALKPLRRLTLALTNQIFKAVKRRGLLLWPLKTEGKEHFLCRICVTSPLNEFRHMGGLRNIKGFTIFLMLNTASRQLARIQAPLTNL